MKSLTKKKVALCSIVIIFGGVVVDFLVLPWMYHFMGNVKRYDNAEILVVQGWIFDTMVDQTVQDIKRGNYQAIVVSGQHSSTAWTKKRLVNRGVDESIVFEAPYSKKTKKDHTFNEAIYIKKMLDAHFPNVTSVNIATGAVHSKKSVTIFRKVLGNKFNVGIVACKPNHYDADHIWKSRHGIYNTTRFFIGYLYALVWRVEWVDQYVCVK